MIGRTVSLAVLALGALISGATAQPREVEVYQDRYGREVVVDVYTGEILDVREPRRERRNREYLYPREERRAERRQDRYYLDDPDDMARLRREKRIEELGRDPYGGRLPQYRDYRALPDPDYSDDYGYEEYPPSGDEGYARRDEWPQPPSTFEERPRYEAVPRVERAPLVTPPDAPSTGEPDIAAAPPTGSTPETVIEEAPPELGLPDPANPPEVAVSGASEDVAKIQILLDRLGVSPGVIDGRMGDNVNKAISAWREMTGEALRTYDKEFIDARLAETGGDPFTTYEITPTDVAGPYVASVPEDYSKKAQMERLSFTSVPEMLAERFHMDEKYLRALNPGAAFDRPGTRIRVINPGAAKKGEVARIVADKGRKQVRAYDARGKLVVAYPATIGSAATPSPTGTHTVERVALDPEYTYNPKINFQQGDNTKVLRIPPGPNGPVGTVWIALSKPTYGIHGTPEPSKIGKTESNGCIRLTNWDAQELAKMVKQGVTVEFVE
ncbi:MAG: L,D-transpeptidase family protein [Aquamicrobium sp.]|uniref:L,D-transpeptidase family protein n=1 Tax=Aquamicrobium sp. TaxID=1872579 RepID=UPI00349E593E|nr:L,D-transpeptidase family protein [Aquamicrobium sp.]